MASGALLLGCAALLLTHASALRVGASSRGPPRARRSGAHRAAGTRRVWGGSERRWTHKAAKPSKTVVEQQRAGVPAPSSPAGAPSSGAPRRTGRSRSAKRTAVYERLRDYSAHFSHLILAEWKAEQELLREQLCEWPCKRLQDEGLLLRQLHIRHVGDLFGNPVLRLSCRSAGSDAMSTLPYHRFDIGDAVALSCGETPVLPADIDDEAGDGECWRGVLLQRTSTSLNVALQRLPADELAAMRRRGPLCLTRHSSVVPYDRCQAAIDTATDPALPSTVLSTELRDLLLFFGSMKSPPPKGGQPPAALSAGATAVSATEVAASSAPQYGGRRIAKGDVKAAVAAAMTPAGASRPALNPTQIGVVRTALQRQLTLIQGPPGTGKTSTACVLAAACVRLHRGVSADGRLGNTGAAVLVTSPSNVAADELLRGMHALGVRAVRVGDAAVVDAEQRNATLDALLEKDRRVVEARAALSTAQGRGAGPGVAGAFEAVKQAESVAARRILLSAPVVVTTCIGAGRLRDLLAPKSQAAAPSERRDDANGAARRRDAAALPPVCSHFQSVLIDEAAQATEPASLVPLLAGCQQLFLVGDPCQLPPTVTGVQAARGGLATPLFARLQLLGVRPLLLDTQYRMHPQLAAFPSQCWYESRLRNAVTAKERPLPQGCAWPNPKMPIAFFSLTEPETRPIGPGGGSYANAAESQAVCSVLQAVLAAGDVVASEVGVITPYNAQVNRIQRLVSTLPAALGGADVQVSSVDGFQGCERDIIIISTVRSNKEGRIGFVSDFRRMNVALTRARRGLVLIGDSNTLNSNPTWATYLTWLRKHGLLVEFDASALKLHESHS